MKAVILAGGLGTRITEESNLRPKPMIEIGGKPILWHIMKIYSHFNINEFIICAGYKSYMIKEYFRNYFLHQSDIKFDIANNCMEVLHSSSEPWKVTVVNTGENTMTGGRIKRIQEFLNPNEPFCLTYGDGVADININKLIESHKKSGKLATLTGVCPPKRFGALRINENSEVSSFAEKPIEHNNGWINGGFFVLNPIVLNLIEDDETIWEKDPLETLALAGQLNAYKHNGFWKPMDTLRDKIELERLWEQNNAPWKIWEQISELSNQEATKHKKLLNILKNTLSVPNEATIT